MLLTGKRMRVHAALFASLLAVVAIVTALGAGLIGYLGIAATQGVRAQLSALDGADLAYQFSLKEGADPVAQDEAVHDLLASAFASDGRPIALQVTRTLGLLGPLAFSVAGTPDDQSGARVSLRSVPDLPDVAELAAGKWPSSATETSLQADAAELLGLTVGDTVLLDDGAVQLKLTGTWRVQNELDPRWVGDGLWLQGTTGTDEVGPLIIDPGIWAQLGIAPRVTWTVTPELASITSADIAVIASVTQSFGSYLRADDRIDASSYGNGGRLPLVSSQVLDRLDGLAAVQPLALLVVAAIALLALVELARLLSGTRATEIELLWSRGATPSRIAASTAAEAGAIALVGAALGTGAALGVLGLLAGTGGIGDVGAAVWAVPLGAIVITAFVFGLSGYLAGRRSAQRDTGMRSGRIRTIAGAGAAVLVTIAAGLASWQLLLYGSPLTPSSDGGTQVDPLAVLAPALVIVAVVLLALVAFPRVSALVERSASARAGVTRVLTARNVGRRPQFAAAPIVLVGLAAAQLVTAAAYGGTWTQSYDMTIELRTGAAVQVQFGRSGGDDAALDAIEAQPGVDAAAPVAALSAGAGTAFNTLVAATPSTVATIANTGLGTFDRANASTLMTPEPWLPELPAGGSIELAFTGDTPTTAALVLTDSAGRITDVELSPDGSGLLTGVLPASTDTWSLQAIDVDGAEQFALAGLSVDGAEVDLGPWWVSYPIQEDGGFADALPAMEAGQGFRGGGPQSPEDFNDGLFHPSTSGAVRMLPSLDGTNQDQSAAPVVISQALADQAALAIGDILPITIGDIEDPLLVVTAGIVPGIPGSNSDRALLMDLQRLTALRLRESVLPPNPDRVWIATSDAPAVVAGLRETLPVGTRFDAAATDQSRTILGSASVALWVAAAGGVALAVIAVGAVAGAQLGGRRDEVVVLRAIGVESRRQAAVRRLELLAVLGYGLIAGVVAGTVTAILTVSALARAAVPRRYLSLATTGTVEPVLLAAGLGALIAFLLVAAWLYGRRVRAQARTLSAREVLL